MASAPPAPSSLLQLIWLASPALPIGGFSYSEVLEAGVEWAGVATESIASDWLLDQLQLALTRSDLPVVTQAIPAWQHGDVARLQQLNDWVLHTRESAELRQQTVQMGRSLVEWLRLHHADAQDQFAHALGDTAPTYPIAFAFAGARTGASVHDVGLAFAFGWAENMVAAAVKSVPLGQSAGQRILARLSTAIPDAVTRALAQSDDDRQAFTPMLAILSARHETQYSRLFRS
jgi:urease accessory protein